MKITIRPNKSKINIITITVKINSMIPIQVSQAPVITGQIVSVGDGDTITIKTSNGNITVRLACIDAPERNQSGGKEAAQRLTAILPKGMSVKVTPVDKDQYGRTVGIVVTTQNINQQLVQEGLAWVYEAYINKCQNIATPLRQAQKVAKEKRVGLWSQSNPCPPWDYRKNQCVTASPVPVPNQQKKCDPSYPDFCIPPAPPDLNCGDIPQRRFRVLQPDPHKFDRDKDGIGCES
ncbi:thermonuclease family protein [Microcoleus sp. A003_D6]|uniref:thermonuclease family protein n=1 Tax=Microcoleus sp. A003_D6 TaxID=3055266 RepID=UPI002FD2ED46